MRKAKKKAATGEERCKNKTKNEKKEEERQEEDRKHSQQFRCNRERCTMR